MDGVMPKPPAEFSALAIATSIPCDLTMSCRWSATIRRPGAAKISPMNRIFISRFWLRERARSEEHTSELQSHLNLVCRLLLEKKKIPTCHLIDHRRCHG